MKKLMSDKRANRRVRPVMVNGLSTIVFSFCFYQSIKINEIFESRRGSSPPGGDSRRCTRSDESWLTILSKNDTNNLT